MALILIEVVVLGVAAIFVARVLAKRPIRREVKAHPLVAVIALLVVVAVAAVGVIVARQSAIGRHLVVGMVGLAAIVAIVRAHPHFGRRRGLPPGSLGLATSLDAIDDPDFYARAARTWGPVFKMSQVHQPVVCIVDLAVGHELFRTHAADLAPSRWSFNRLVPGGYIEYMRGSTHGKYRAALGRAFADMRLDGARQVARVMTRDQLQLISRVGASGLDPEPFLLPVAMASLLKSILGVDPGHPRAARLTELFTDLIRPIELRLPVPRRARDTYAALVAEVRAIATGWSIDGLPSDTSLLGALVRREPAALGDDTLVGNLVLMVKEGSIMVRGLLRWVLKRQADDPAFTSSLRTDPLAAGEFSRRFVLEVLRLHESRYVYRRATRDLTSGAFRIPRGWLVRLCVGEAHERADVFRDPRSFDPDRFDGDPLARGEVVPFGRGDHACLGGELALAIAQSFVEETAAQFDVRTTADGPPWRINRHWGLWRPSPDWRVQVVPRT